MTYCDTNAKTNILYMKYFEQPLLASHVNAHSDYMPLLYLQKKVIKCTQITQILKNIQFSVPFWVKPILQNERPTSSNNNKQETYNWMEQQEH